MFAESLRLRVRRHGVSVTLASPGFVDTPKSQQVQTTNPFMITPDAAAKILHRNISRRRKDFAFPWPYALVRRLFLWLPRGLQRLIAGNLPE
jgi:short-subunit dehydrogenase